MLFAFQALFVGTTAWDFFLTVIVQESVRSHIFLMLPAGLSIFIIAPWLIGLFILTGSLIVFAFHKDFGPPMGKINFEYGGIMIVYVILFILSVFNPAVSWPFMLNYLINIIWAWSLICFRLAAQRGDKVFG